jgi:hypothetical protein
VQSGGIYQPVVQTGAPRTLGATTARDLVDREIVSRQRVAASFKRERGERPPLFSRGPNAVT